MMRKLLAVAIHTDVGLTLDENSTT